MCAVHRKQHNSRCLQQDGAQHSLHPRSVQLALPPLTSDAAGDWRTLAPLAAATEARIAALAADALPLAWELLRDTDAKEQDFSTAEFAELLLGDCDAPDALLAAHRLLHSPEGALLFREAHTPGRWAARSAAHVDELRAASAAQAAATDAKRAFAEALLAAPAAKPAASSWDGPEAPPQWAAWTAALEAFALDEESPARASGEDVFAWVYATANVRAPARAPAAAAALLASAGRWRAHENLSARRHRVPLSFDPVLSAAAAALAEADASSDVGLVREDLTRLRAFTVDSAETTEYDDALSAEALSASRTRIWVHIADPSRLIRPGDALDAEALRRGSTVYFPTGSVPMFPHALAAGPMSLRAASLHGTSAALSFAAELDEEGCIIDAFVVPSRISVTYRLTYAEADELLGLGLHEEPELMLLARAAAARHAWRAAHGAVTIDLPEASLRVRGAPGTVTASGADADAAVDIACDMPRAPGTGARALVSEMMILAGEVAAALGAAANLPLPYRGQLAPALPSADELAALPPGPCRAVALRSCMTPSTCGLVPASHASLGLDAYVQVTSPIRRYVDMLAHYQLKAHLAGTLPPLSEQQLRAALETATAAAASGQRAAREAERYWTAVFFASQPPGTLYSGTVLRILRDDLGLVSVLLDGLGLEMAVKVARDVRPGDALVVECTGAKPREGTVFFREKHGSPRVRGAGG
jgi:exoribonuclease-2